MADSKERYLLLSPVLHYRKKISRIALGMSFPEHAYPGIIHGVRSIMYPLKRGSVVHMELFGFSRTEISPHLSLKPICHLQGLLERTAGAGNQGCNFAVALTGRAQDTDVAAV